jgi:hypothetical protein
VRAAGGLAQQHAALQARQATEQGGESAAVRVLQSKLQAARHSAQLAREELRRAAAQQQAQCGDGGEQQSSGGAGLRDAAAAAGRGSDGSGRAAAGQQ